VLLAASMVLMSVLLSVSTYIIAGTMLLTYIGFSLFQTAMINSVSQTLPKEEIGVGMGIFNLVTIISGAVGIAVVGKVLDTAWLAFPLLSVIPMPKSYIYSNVLLFFSVMIIIGGILYIRGFSKTQPEKISLDCTLPDCIPGNS
jgi:MFS transporter, DHA2 family, metal-tetracycline-proton antiporter